MQEKDVPAKAGISGVTLAAGAGAGLVVGALIWALALNRPDATTGATTGATTDATTGASTGTDGPASTASSAAGTAAATAAGSSTAQVATAEPTAEPVAVAAPAPVPAPESAPESAAEPTSVPAAIDTVRAEADGTVLVAGSAPPGAVLSILVDGQVAGQAKPDPQGKFATFLSLAPSATPRVLSLSGKTADGQALLGPAEVILNPMPAMAAAEAAQTASAASEPVDAGAPAAVTAPPAPEAAGAAAPASPSVLLADDNGVTKLTDATPLAEVMIDTIGYDRLGNVDIAGRGGDAGVVRLYIDNQLTATAPLAADGKWRAKLTAVTTGVHTLRADQIDPGGKVTSRAETPFQREEPAKVAAVPLTPDTTSADATSPAAAPTAVAAPKTKAEIITVQPGFTLWAIARASYGDGLFYVRVYEANKDQIRDPDLIYPGQIFTVPAAD